MKDPNAEAPKEMDMDLPRIGMRKPAPAPEPIWDNTTLCFIGDDCPNCERKKRTNPAPAPVSDKGAEVEPVTKAEADKATLRILRARLAEAEAGRETWKEQYETETRSFQNLVAFVREPITPNYEKPMHGEHIVLRDTLARLFGFEIMAKLARAEKACALALDYVQGSPRPRHMDVVSALREVIARAKEGRRAHAPKPPEAPGVDVSPGSAWQREAEENGNRLASKCECWKHEQKGEDHAEK